MTEINFAQGESLIAATAQPMLQIAERHHNPCFRPISSQAVEPLREEEQDEVLAFLTNRAEQTFMMTGWILDNGIVSEMNRGTFYGHRDRAGRLDGLALVGHVTLFETQNEEALATFARLAKDCASVNTIIAEAEELDVFLSYYDRDGETPRMICRERLLEACYMQPEDQGTPRLRLATLEDLDLIAPVHAQMAFEESGKDPLLTDREGFYRRCVRRIKQERVWIHVQDRELIFKADVISDTPEVIYLEGVYVNCTKRGIGLGSRFLKQLTNRLLAKTKSVCLLVNHKNDAAGACYKKAGYQCRDLYDTVYLTRTLRRV